MANMETAMLRAEVERLIKTAEDDVQQWRMARGGLSFPDFDSDIRTDEAWQSGLSEGKEIGRLNALKEILTKLID